MISKTIAAVVISASFAHAAEVPVKKELEVEYGRYQLFQGTYSTFDLRRSETYTHSSVFLIDTKTGQVKRYINKIDAEGRYIEGWLPTELSQEKTGTVK